VEKPVVKQSVLKKPVSLGLVLCLIALSGCLPGRKRGAEALTQGSDDLKKFDNSLSFNNVVLEQANDDGKLLWKIKAQKASYSKDQKNAAVEKPEGELYQDGKVIFKLVADKAEVIQDGKSVQIKGQITATDLRDGTILKGNEIEWKPAEDVLFVRNKFTGVRQQMTIAGDEGKFLSRKREAEVKGKVVTAEAKDQNLKVQGTELKWFLEKQVIVADKPLTVDRAPKDKPVDHASADKGSVDMKAKIATLTQNAKLNAPAQNLNVSSNQLIWDMNKQEINAPLSLTLITPQINLTADKGRLDMQQKQAYLNGKVRGTSQNQAAIAADAATWNLTTQAFTADGNINYSQPSPPANLVGTKAFGTLQDQQVTVTGGPEGDNRVVTEIVLPPPKQ
jgi:LPS export ABC transporter protein LptC